MKKRYREKNVFISVVESCPYTIHTFLSEHGRLRVFSPEAVGVRWTDLLGTGVAAAIVHFGLINVRQKALVAVFICDHSKGEVIINNYYFSLMQMLLLLYLKKKKNSLPAKSSKVLVFSKTTSFSPLDSPLVDLVRYI